MTKRIFAVVIAIAMVCTMFAFASSAAETTTVRLDASVTEYGWDQILNAINFNNYDENEDGWKDVPEVQNLRSMLLYGLSSLGWAPGDPNYNAILYTFPVYKLIDAGIAWIGERPADDVRFCDYMQNTFGAVAYALRGGKQKALDLWNTYFPGQEATLVGDTAFTYYNNTKYTDDSFNAALACLKAYMTYAQDNQVCNVGTAGRWTAQKARYASLENALNALVEGTPEVVPTTTVTLNTANNYNWYGYLNVVNVIPDTETEGLRAEGTPYKVFLTEMLAIMNGNGAASDAAYMNSYAMSDGTLLKDYAQDTFGAYAYVLRGGRQKAADYWNSKLSVGITLGNNSYTYTNAASQNTYDAAKYQAAIDALNDYMANTGDSSCFDVENGGGRFFDQRTKYNALVAAVDALPQAPVDFSDVVTTDADLELLVAFYENVDVDSYKMKEVVQTWARAMYDGAKAGKTAAEIIYDGYNVTWHWENVIRDEVLLSNGAKTAADAVMLDNTLWPGGTAITDQNQITYNAVQYQEVYDLWVLIRDTYRQDYMNTKTSMVVNKCEELRTKIQALEAASLPFTTEQKEAYSVLKDYVPLYRGRVERVVLDSNKATAIYKDYVAIVERAEGYIALDWVTGTSASYPSVEEMHALIMPGAMGGSLENDWYPFRQAFGLDNNGYDTLLNNTYNAWVKSGKYTEASLADVKARIDNFEAANLSGNRSSNNTDAGAQEDIEYYQAFLVEKPVGPVSTLKIAGANVSLQESISLFFAIDPACASEYTDLYVEFKKGDVVTTSSETVNLGGRTCFRFSNIAAKEVNDTITVTLYGTFNGKVYKAEEYSYSVATYCYNRLAKSSDAKFKRVCVDLLNYGAAAQTYFSYNTENLANAALTDEQKAFGSTEYSALTDNRTNSGEYTDYGVKAFNLVYEEVIKVLVAVEAKDLNGVVAKVTLDGKVYEIASSEFTPLTIGGVQCYAFYFTNILPNQTRSVFSVTLEKDGVAVGNTMTYSIESYLARQIPRTTNAAYKDLMESTAKYSDACVAMYG